MKATEPIRNKKQIKEFLNYLCKSGQYRNYVLATLCLHTALRISDILRLSCNDVYDFKNQSLKKSITIIEKKTGKTKTIPLHKNILKALKYYYQEAKPNTPLVLNKRTGKAISRIQAYRLLCTAAEFLGFKQRVSCHSLRKTFGYHAWKDGTSPAVIMEIYNHSSLAITRRYLGVTQDDMNIVYINLNLSG